MNSIVAGPVARESGQFPDPVTFAAAASQAAWRRSASIVTAHTAGAVVSGALRQQAPAPSQHTGDDRRRAGAQRASAA
jgi:hypothetical protein